MHGHPRPHPQPQEEVGPLTYIKHRVKVDVWWDRRGRVAVKVGAGGGGRRGAVGAWPKSTVTDASVVMGDTVMGAVCLVLLRPWSGVV